MFSLKALVGCRDETSSPECAENTSDPHLGEDQTGESKTQTLIIW